LKAARSQNIKLATANE